MRKGRESVPHTLGERPVEDTARRRPSAMQKEGLHQDPTPLAHWSQTPTLQYCEKDMSVV